MRRSALSGLALFALAGLWLACHGGSSHQTSDAHTASVHHTEPAGPTTTVVVVRHAEKEKDVEDPGLTVEGQARANRLLDLMRNAGVTAVYATEYRRTQDTVGPLAEALDLEVQVHAARDTSGMAETILENHTGGVIVAAAHSNTVPAIVEALGGPAAAEIAPPKGEIDESEYHHFFVVTVPAAGGSASLLRLTY